MSTTCNQELHVESYAPAPPEACFPRGGSGVSTCSLETQRAPLKKLCVCRLMAQTLLGRLCTSTSMFTDTSMYQVALIRVSMSLAPPPRIPHGGGRVKTKKLEGCTPSDAARRTLVGK